VCARKTTRKDKPDPRQVIANAFPWQKVKVADEGSVITDVATFLYPEDMGINGHERKQARERVRSAINLHRRLGTLQPPVSRNPKTLQVQDFLDFACGRWPALQSVVDSFNVSAQLFPMKKMTAEIGQVEVFITNPPETYDDLLIEYRRVLEAWREDRRLLEETQQKLAQREEAREQKREYAATRH
jgi:hypothetical protein